MPPIPDLAILSAQKPILETTSDRIDYLSGRAIKSGLPNDHLAMIGEGVVDLPAGRFVLRTISDDGVCVDGKLVIVPGCEVAECCCRRKIPMNRCATIRNPGAALLPLVLWAVFASAQEPPTVTNTNYGSRSCARFLTERTLSI